jgi:serine/threonine-protein kinase
LDYIPGLNLKQHVSMHGVFSEAEVLQIAGQVAEVLEYLHNFNPPIIHRDLTPDNLVTRDPDKAIILIDFGAANEFVGNMTGTLIGKQSYIPPEQFQGEAVAQSDLYALGATMFFLLTGVEPEPISASRPRELNKKVSAEMDELVFQLTQELPENRIESARELRRRLSKFPAC